MDSIKIVSNRFTLRTLHFNDTFDSYLSWMRDVENNKYILNARRDYSLEELVSFLDGNNRSPNEILLGIFTESLEHIGNIRYSNINRSKKSTEVGFLIGSLKFRGLGVAEEVFLCSMEWINAKLQIETVYLGVDPRNTPAVKLYKKLGFSYIASPRTKPKEVRMKLEFQPRLTVPAFT